MPMSPRLLRPRASGGFDPRSISGCLCNLDASVMSSLFQNSDGTTAATATDDPVGYWADLSGLGNHARQTVATGSRPFLKLNNQNGKPGLLWDGSNDWMTASIAGFKSLTGVTVVSVHKSSAAAAADTNSFSLFCFGNLGGASAPYEAASIALISSTGAIAGEYISVAYNVPGSAGRLGSTTYRRSSNVAELLAISYGSGGTSLLKNNSAVTLDLASSITTSTNTAPSTFTWTPDDEVHIGATRSGASIAAGPAATFHQFIVYNRVLSSAELTSLWNNLRGKWGLT